MKVIVILVALAIPTFAQQIKQIDPAKSKITIHAYKAGLFSFAGHDHFIEAPIASGTIDENRKTVEITIRADDMKVLDPEESEKNRAEIRQTMLGNKLLDAERYPVIVFRSLSFNQLTPETAEIGGELAMHGVVRPVRVVVKKVGERYTGSAKLKQTDYGMKPVSVAGGTIKVKDEVKIDFSVETHGN